MFRSFLLISTVMASSTALAVSTVFGQMRSNADLALQNVPANHFKVQNFGAVHDEKVDAQKVNQVIEEIISKSLDSDPVIKGLSLKVSPELDVEAGKIEAELAARVATTTWAQNHESEMALRIGTHMNPINSIAKEGVIGARTIVTTPVLAMIRYVFGSHLKDDTDKSDVYYTVAVKFSQVQDMNELYNATSDLIKLMIENIKDESDLAFVKGLKLSATDESNGKVASFSIVQTEPLKFDFSSKVEFRNMHLSFSEKSFSAGMEVAGIIETADFNDYVKTVKEYLLALQERNESHLKMVQDTLDGYIQMVKEFLNS